MAWLIAIVCLILIAVFWRILLPIALAIGILLLVGVGGLLLYQKNESDKYERNRMQAEKAAQEKIARASAAAQDRIAKARIAPDGIDPVWKVSTEIDPASGSDVPRSASVMSDNGLCRLQIEQRINATRLAGLQCRGLKISPVSSIEVKFDNRPTSEEVRIEQFSNSDDVFIPSSPVTRGRHLPYDEFLQRMTSAKKLAVLLPFEGAGSHWVAFSLGGSGPALLKIGAIVPAGADRQEGVPKAPMGAQQRSPQGGVARSLPKNAELNVYGNDWKCIGGYRRSGSECVAVQLPSNAELNVYGNDWKCVRGYRRSGTECIAVVLPSNAELNVYGNDWKCIRGYYRSGSECVQVGVPSTVAR